MIDKKAFGQQFLQELPRIGHSKIDRVHEDVIRTRLLQNTAVQTGIQNGVGRQIDGFDAGRNQQDKMANLSEILRHMRRLIIRDGKGTALDAATR